MKGVDTTRDLDAGEITAAGALAKASDRGRAPILSHLQHTIKASHYRAHAQVLKNRTSRKEVETVQKGEIEVVQLDRSRYESGRNGKQGDGDRV
jgi:hypothetical protein